MSKFPFRRTLGTGVLAMLAVSATIPGAAAATRQSGSPKPIG